MPFGASLVCLISGRHDLSRKTCCSHSRPVHGCLNYLVLQYPEERLPKFEPNMRFSSIAVAFLSAFHGSCSSLLGYHDSLNDIPGLDIRAVKKSHKHHHIHGVVPDFRQPCICEADHCPTFLNSKALCECKNAAVQACYFRSERGCPEPRPRAC
ncbi:hypothetical protein B0T22DRAFT_470177 [Podospora appendiculata]|uniref:Uncharacterized protein n=1 Tax=Podospora appendiculata TaxID=314037 RepID=A0AAE0X0I9_9PEZI|nr:hypothetical protein B0T22DRAFT_470177 [Podospora appendiculata]